MACRSLNISILIFAALALSGCVTAKMHSEAELNTIGQRCGLALGELVQDDSEKRLLFLIRIAPSIEQRVCVNRWARRNHLKSVFIDAINFPES